MSPMIAAAPPSASGSASAASGASRAARLLGSGLALALSLFAPAVAVADTGAALPQGYTNDIPAGQTAAPTVVVQQVSDTDEDESDDYADADPSALTDFQEPLAPYGVWIDDGSYGTVWVPDPTIVGADFAPYQSSGHWALDDNSDWMWASDYDWGYIPFHYGRWVWIGGRGWAWIPGRVYAPAWVTWRVGDAGYIGWAPMPPTWYWSGGVAVGLWTTPYAAYCFCPTQYVFHERLYAHVVRDAAVVRTAAAGTRAYKAASPTVNGAHGNQPESAKGSRHGGFRPAAPSLTEAGVSAGAAPKARVAPDVRARNFATRASTAAVRRGNPSSRALQGSALPSHRAGSENPWIGGPTPIQRGAGPRAPSGDLSSRGAPVYNHDMGAQAPRFAPPAAGAAQAPRFAPPGAGAAQAPRFAPPAPVQQPHFAPPVSAPRFAPPPAAASRPSTPSFRPSTPSFRPSTPSFRPSTPSFRPSTPSFRPSTPSFRPSPSGGGGGRSGGGGHRR